jgi:hypothetical protein
MRSARIVIYRRGDRLVEILAEVDRTVFQTPNGLVETRDYLIRRERMISQGLSDWPMAGEMILDEGSAYVITAPHGTEPHFRFSDPYRKAMRIHTMEAGKECI